MKQNKQRSLVLFYLIAVTFEERAKAKKLIEEDSEYIKKKKDEKKLPRIPPSSMLSRGEKVLY